MRVFITGGSGYIGQAVVEALVAEGHDVEALVRERADASVVSDIGAEPRLGHLGELDLLRAAGDRADALALDQQFTARHARDQLGWIPREAGVLEYLADSAVPAR
jgi:uncharacterized protein YbjT (DUF2867 family)